MSELFDLLAQIYEPVFNALFGHFSPRVRVVLALVLTILIIGGMWWAFYDAPSPDPRATENAQLQLTLNRVVSINSYIVRCLHGADDVTPVPTQQLGGCLEFYGVDPDTTVVPWIQTLATQPAASIIRTSTPTSASTLLVESE